MHWETRQKVIGVLATLASAMIWSICIGGLIWFLSKENHQVECMKICGERGVEQCVPPKVMCSD